MIDFDKLVKENPKGFSAWKSLCESRKCFMCKKKINIINPRPRDSTSSLSKFINQDFLFHVYSSHGLPPDLVREWIADAIRYPTKSSVE